MADREMKLEHLCINGVEYRPLNKVTIKTDEVVERSTIPRGLAKRVDRNLASE